MIKIFLALTLTVLSLFLGDAINIFKPLLVFYLLISIFVLYRLIMEAYIIYYSGAEVQLEGEEARDVNVSKNWDVILFFVVIMSLTPALWFIPTLQKIPGLASALLLLSIIPDVARKRLWKAIIKDLKTEER